MIVNTKTRIRMEEEKDSGTKYSLQLEVLQQIIVLMIKKSGMKLFSTVYTTVDSGRSERRKGAAQALG